MAEVLIPERRSVLSKFAGLFQQGAGMMETGAKAKSAWGSIMGGGTAATTATTGATGAAASGGGAGGAGVGAGAAAASKYTLGTSSFTPVTTGMSPTLGGGAPAGGAAGGGGSAATTGSTTGAGTSAIGQYAPYAAPAAALGTAAYDEYKYQSGVREGTRDSQGPGRYAIGQGQKTTSWQDKVSKGFADPYGAMKTNWKNSGLGLTDGDSMSAIERRQASQQNAMRDIVEAQKALKVAGLPPDEARSIGMKLEKARQNIGGKSRGNSIYTRKA